MGTVEYGRNVTIHPSARINVLDRLVIGDNSTIHENVIIEGREVEIGNEAWILPGAIIGGGSKFEEDSTLKTGHFFHMGRDTLVNIAKPIRLGNEVGLGTRTALYTHGAYVSQLEGFPVAFGPINIGHNVWLPGATVNPYVDIGDNVVVGVGSVVTKSIPSGSLAAGVPAKVIKENAYPREVPLVEFWKEFSKVWPEVNNIAHVYEHIDVITVRGASFFPRRKSIQGEVTPDAERLRDLLRKHGVRFYSRPDESGKFYEDWN